jgi:hypothetical protein
MRRRAGDRPLVRVLELVQVATAIAATIALALAIARAGDVTTSRRDAAADSCHLLRGLVLAGSTHDPQDRAAERAYINRTPLRDCRAYARLVIR